MKLMMCRSFLKTAVVTAMCSAHLLMSGPGASQDNATAQEEPANTSTRAIAESPFTDISDELKDELFIAYKNRGAAYQSRTVHFASDGSPQYINRLIKEDSRYLLQHAHNPVNWHPWGREAFEKAKQQNKPVFLSIGYATVAS